MKQSLPPPPFTAEDLPREWAGQAALAQICERARLTEPEAQVVLLRLAYGRTLAEIAALRGWAPNYTERMWRQGKGKAGALLAARGEAGG